MPSLVLVSSRLSDLRRRGQSWPFPYGKHVVFTNGHDHCTRYLLLARDYNWIHLSHHSTSGHCAHSKRTVIHLSLTHSVNRWAYEERQLSVCVSVLTGTGAYTSSDVRSPLVTFYCSTQFLLKACPTASSPHPAAHDLCSSVIWPSVSPPMPCNRLFDAGVRRQRDVLSSCRFGTICIVTLCGSEGYLGTIFRATDGVIRQSCRPRLVGIHVECLETLSLLVLLFSTSVLYDCQKFSWRIFLDLRRAPERREPN